MRPHWIILAVTIILFILALVGLIFKPQILEDFADFALILTLAAVLIYVYYTYLLAKDAWTPSAAFSLKPYSTDPYHFAFIIQNHSKASLNCWCNLNVTVYNKTVPLSGFYGGQKSFDIQPFGAGMGHFDIQDILGKVGYNLKQMKQAAGSSSVKDQLYLDIEFWYNPIGKKSKVRNPQQPHYFDFARDVMVADF